MTSKLRDWKPTFQRDWNNGFVVKKKKKGKKLWLYRMLGLKNILWNKNNRSAVRTKLNCLDTRLILSTVIINHIDRLEA